MAKFVKVLRGIILVILGLFIAGGMTTLAILSMNMKDNFVSVKSERVSPTNCMRLDNTFNQECKK